MPPTRLSDLGQTLSWLDDLQVKPWLSKKRQRFLDDALRVYGVKQEGGALERPLGSLDELVDGLVLLGQACVRVADLAYTRRSSLQSTFVEQVEEVIVDTGVPFESQAELEGRFGKPVVVDIPHARSPTSLGLAHVGIGQHVPGARAVERDLP